MSTVNSPEGKEAQKFEDRISQLADDILIYILSHMEMKEAARTSILSTSWRYLWTNFTSLNFDGSETFVECRRRHKFIKDERPKFVNWVNQVVSLHRAQSINDFRLRFELDSTHADHIDRWVTFAILKRVNKLELDFDRSNTVGSSVYPPYTLQYNALMGFAGDNISFLTSLYFNRVNISGGLLELLLSRCPLLDTLIVEQSHDLVNLKITNSSRRLKYLALRNCFKIKELEVDAANLASFKFKCWNRTANVVYTSVPSLTEACFSGDYCNGLIPSFRPIKGFAAHLSKLSLDIKMIHEEYDIPYFDNVKHLELIVHTVRCHSMRHRSLLLLRCFPEACPLLHEFKLQAKWVCHCNVESESETDSDSEAEYAVEDVHNWLDSDSEAEYAVEDVHNWLENVADDESSGTLPHLRKMEWVGGFSAYFRQFDAELVLVLYLLKNAIKLENFSFDPRRPTLIGTPPESENMANIEASRNRAAQLAVVIPSRVDLMIL